MARATAVVEIYRGQYTLWDLDGVPRPPGSGVNGLFELSEGIVLILTGTQDGRMRLTVETSSKAPPLELEGWDDVVEVSQLANNGVVGVVSLLTEEPVDELPALEVEPGSFVRIRVHARGRDEADKEWDIIDEPLEEHLLQMWPAPEGEEDCHRLSDEFGKTLRSQHSPSAASKERVDAHLLQSAPWPSVEMAARAW